MRDSTAARACDGCTWTNTGQPLPARTAIAQRPLEPATGAPGQTRVNHYTHARMHARTHGHDSTAARACDGCTWTNTGQPLHARTHGHHSTAARACDGCTWTNTGQPLHARTHAHARTHGHHSTAARACDGCTWTNTGQPLHARTAITQRPLEPATGAPGQTRVNHYTHTRTHGHHSTAARACDGCTWTNTGQPLHTRTHGHHSTAARACDGCTWTNTGQPLHARTHARPSLNGR